MLHPDLQEAIALYQALKAEADKGVVGLDAVKEKTFIAFMSEIPTTLSAKKNRRVNAGLVWYRGVPGVGKTYMVLVLAKTTESAFARVQGRADLTPGDIVGVEIFNPKTCEWEKRPGPVVRANILLLDEGNRISPEVPERVFGGEPGPHGDPGRLHVRTARVLLRRHDHEPRGNRRRDVPALGGERRPLHVSHRCGIPFPGRGAETGRLRHQGGGCRAARETAKGSSSFDRSSRPGLPSTRRSRNIFAGSSAPPVRITRTSTAYEHSPSPLVEEFVELGASPRATIAWGPTSRVRALFVREDDKVLPEDIQALAKNILSHRINLKSRARKAGVTVEDVINEIVERVPIP